MRPCSRPTYLCTILKFKMHLHTKRKRRKKKKGNNRVGIFRGFQTKRSLKHRFLWYKKKKKAQTKPYILFNKQRYNIYKKTWFSQLKDNLYNGLVINVIKLIFCYRNMPYHLNKCKQIKPDFFLQIKIYNTKAKLKTTKTLIKHSTERFIYTNPTRNRE